MPWFPTFEWFEEYKRELNRNDEFQDLASDWGTEFNGDFVFRIEDVPVDEHRLGDLPDELIELRKMPDDIWDDVPDPIEEQVVEQVGDEPVYRMFSLVDDNVREALPDYLRELLIEAEELFDENPTYAEIPDELSDEIRSILPEHLDSLLYQLEEFVDEEGNVHAFMAIEDGEVTEIGVLDSPDEREAGFVLVGPYENWEEFVGGEDIIEVVMSGDLEPRGDMTKLLEYSDAMQEMGETAGRLETRYLLRSGGQPVESPSGEE